MEHPAMTAPTTTKFSLSAVILVLLLVATPIFAQQPSQTTSALPSEKRVLIISIDGMRPDVLLRAKAPNIRELTRHGSFTFWAESTDMAITLPTHVSMLTGVTPAKHHVTWNDDRKVKSGDFSVPTLFEFAKKAGFSTAMVVGKHKLGLIAKPGMVDWFKAPGLLREDSLSIAARAAQVIREHRPQVMFVHFSDTDNIGHSSGWGTPQQVTVADRVDQGVGELMEALRESGLREKTLVIVTADHGGSGHSHGADVPFSHYIPWIAVGPGVRENYDLTLEPDLSVHVEDVFATAMNFLGIALPANSDGKPVVAIFTKPGKYTSPRK
jgi:predicted AlkP superfamily pyrophosphatase or phosphodiesterase